jgi:uncharacterized protein YbjT (DUF2867 family)
MENARIAAIDVDDIAEVAATVLTSSGHEGEISDALGELFAERRKGKEAQVLPVAQMILGRCPVSFEEFAVRNAAIFRGAS